MNSSLRHREYLLEMAQVPSLKQLQRKGNRKPATDKELQNARKRARRLKTPIEARAAAKYAWEMMDKAQIIQVFLDREAELLNPQKPVPKPLFMDKRVVHWGSLSKEDRESAASWLAHDKTESQLKTYVRQSIAADEKEDTMDSRAKVKVYQRAMKLWKENQIMWKRSANISRRSV